MKSPITKAIAVNARGRPSGLQHRRPEQEIHPGADKSAERRAESERRRAHAGFELLGQPKAEEREVAAEEAAHKQPRDERREPVGKIERPAEAADNRNRQSFSRSAL